MQEKQQEFKIQQFTNNINSSIINKNILNKNFNSGNKENLNLYEHQVYLEEDEQIIAKNKQNDEIYLNINKQKEENLQQHAQNNNYNQTFESEYSINENQKESDQSIRQEQEQKKKFAFQIKKAGRIIPKQEKQEIIDEVNKQDENIYQIAVKYQVPVKTIQRWVNQQNLNLQAGRKPQDPQMEEQLFQFIVQNTNLNKKKVTRRAIKQKSIQLSNYPNFKASKGWYDKFAKRYDIIEKMNEIIQQHKNPQNK